MAFLARRGRGRIEIRETIRTPRGPRSRTLASFRGALSPRVLEQAAARAERPFDPERLRARAREIGVPIVEWSPSPAARQLLGELRRGDPLDGVVVALLREALEGLEGWAAPAELAEVVEWLGASDAERGHALRGLLRVSDRIVHSRTPPKLQWRPRFPRFDSGVERGAEQAAG